MEFHLFPLLLRHQMPDVIFRGILILCHRFVRNSTCSNSNLASYALRGSKNTPLYLQMKQKTPFLNTHYLALKNPSKHYTLKCFKILGALLSGQARFLKASSPVTCYQQVREQSWELAGTQVLDVALVRAVIKFTPLTMIS